MISQPFLWERVKGKLEVLVVGEADYVGTEAQVEAQVPQVSLFLVGGLGGCARRVGVLKKGAWDLCSQKTRTFWEVVVLGVLGGGC